MPTETQIQEARIRSNPMVENLLVNPGFEVWQRGVGPFTTHNTFTSDEWRLYAPYGGSPAVQRSSSPLTGTYCAQVSCSDFISINQGIEAYKALGDQWVTASLWAKTFLENSVWMRLWDYNGSSYDIAESQKHTGSGEWEQLVLTKRVRTGLQPDAAGCHGFGMQMETMQTSGVAFFDGAVLTRGYFPEGVPFVPPNPAEDQERCQRFYQTSGGESRSTGIWRQDVVSGSQYWLDKIFQTPMQATPTITLVNGGASGFGVGVGTVQLDTKGFKEYRTATTTSAASYFWTYWEAEVP